MSGFLKQDTPSIAKISITKSTKKLMKLDDVAEHSQHCAHKHETAPRKSFELDPLGTLLPPGQKRKPSLHIFPLEGQAIYPANPEGLKIPIDHAFEKYWQDQRSKYNSKKVNSPKDLVFGQVLRSVLQNVHGCNSGGTRVINNNRQKYKSQEDEEVGPTKLSKVYYDLKRRRYARGPDLTKFRREKFTVLEERHKELEASFKKKSRKKKKLCPGGNLALGVGDDKIQFVFQSKCKCKQVPPFQLPPALKRYHLKLWTSFLKRQMQREENDWSFWSEMQPDFILEPQDKISHGCERIQGLAELQPNVTFTIVKRFVTGPCGETLFFLNRTDAVECWRRIIQQGSHPTVKPCCVAAPIRPKRKLEIPSLLDPSLPQGISKSTLNPISSKAYTNKSKKLSQVHVPPFCDPFPPEDMRMPWHIPPLRPKDADIKGEGRMQYTVERTTDLEDIIGRRWDAYGEERNKQKLVRAVEAREQMVNPFFNKSEPHDPIDTAELFSILVKNTNTPSSDDLPSVKSRKELAIAQLLKRNDYSNNTADSQRNEELKQEKLKRQNARDHFMDFSHITSRYLDISTRGKQIKRTKTWKSKRELKFI